MDIVTYLRGRASLADPLETVFIKIGLISVMEAADEIERLREALREIAEDDLSHRDRPNRLSAIARAALGEENPFEDRWDD